MLNTGWSFLVPDPKENTLKSATVWETIIRAYGQQTFDWKNITMLPESYLSKYCVIPGQDHGRQGLIERTAFQLIDSVESFVNEERRILKNNKNKTNDFMRLYIPIIVTTAQLFVMRFIPDQISLQDGKLPADTPFNKVDYIRFRKCLSTDSDISNYEDIRFKHKTNEKTVYIVNANCITRILSEIDFPVGTSEWGNLGFV